MTITASEYARRHNVDKACIAYHIKKGNLKTAVKVGGSWLIDENEPYPISRRAENFRAINEARRNAKK